MAWKHLAPTERRLKNWMKCIWYHYPCIVSIVIIISSLPPGLLILFLTSCLTLWENGIAMGFHVDICYGNSHSMPQAVTGTQCQHDSCYKLANEGNNHLVYGRFGSAFNQNPIYYSAFRSPHSNSDDVLTFWWPMSPQNLGQVVLNTSEYSLHWSIMWFKYMATDSTG